MNSESSGATTVKGDGQGSRANAGFVGDEQPQGSGYGEMRRCHSDTSINDGFGGDENPKDLISDLRESTVGVTSRTRHLSQPGPPRGFAPRARHDKTPRPARSANLVSMDGLVYDPINRKFIKRTNAMTDSNPDLSYAMRKLSPSQRNSYMENGSPQLSYVDVRMRNPQMNKIQRNANNLDNSFLNPPDLLFNKSLSRNNLDTRSMGGASMQRSFLSMKDVVSLASGVDHHTMPPSTEEEKNRSFKSMLTTVSSCIYAMFIVTVGLIIFIYDIFVSANISESYCIYLVLVGFMYLIYLLVDLRLYVRKAQKHYKQKKEYEEAYDAMLKITEVETLDGPLSFAAEHNENKDVAINIPQPAEPLDHPYCFTHGRHAGSFYLKLGAAGFCLGHLVHSALLLSLQVLFLDSESDCGSVVVLVLDIIYPLYSFCQLFFIFKYSNVIILRNKGLGRIALMHSIASSLCFWVWTIIRETMDAIVIKNDGKNETKDDYLGDFVEEDIFSYRRTVGDEVRAFIGSPSEIKKNCSKLIGFDSIFTGLSPYLYPFTVEYSILIVGIFYIIWANIGDCPKEESGKEEYHDKSEWIHDESTSDPECKLPTAVEDNGLTSNLVIHIDCHSANKGLFAGMFVVVLTIAALIMSFVLFPDADLSTSGMYLLRSSDIILHLIMLIAVLIAYAQIRKLDINPHPISLLDDILLFICIPAFVMDMTFTIIAMVEHEDYLMLAISILVTIQALIQTMFIADGLRRCSNTKLLHRTKPGREMVTFLIVCNVATWIFMSFSVKSASKDDVRYDFYGKVLWSILGHISTPLCMFFRFHSSVCLVDIWKAAYQPGNAH